VPLTSAHRRHATSEVSPTITRYRPGK